MRTVESPEGQELQNLGREAWDNPAYSGPPSPHGTLRICTISSAVCPQPQPKKPEDGPQKKAHRILVSSCCLQIFRRIRGSWWGRGSGRRALLGYWSQEKESPKAGVLVGLGECNLGGSDLKKRWHLSVPLRCVNHLCRAVGPGTQKPVCVAQRGSLARSSLGSPEGYAGASLRKDMDVMML